MIGVSSSEHNCAYHAGRNGGRKYECLYGCRFRGGAVVNISSPVRDWNGSRVKQYGSFAGGLAEGVVGGPISKKQTDIQKINEKM